MKWWTYAEYDDGSTITAEFPYKENGNVTAENDRQYEIEDWLINSHEGCKYYSVVTVHED